MKKSLLLFFVLLLSACRSTSQSPPTPSIEIMLKPSATATISASPTPTAVTPTITPQPTMDQNYLRDEFEGSLDAEWSWIRERPLDWSLETMPGSLQINVDHGYVAAHDNPNLLLRPAPAGDFQIET